MMGLILGLALTFANATIHSQEYYTENGLYVRLINDTGIDAACFIADDRGSYYEFRSGLASCSF